MTKPSVSIILPTFNRLEFLRVAVESVRAQTFTDWELIIADDGSDHETLAYLRALHSPPRVKLIELAHTGNPGAVRNAGVRQSRGEYIAFLDSDDRWMPGKLGLQIASLRGRADCRWSYTGYARIDANGGSRPSDGEPSWVPYRGAILEPLLAHVVEIFTPSVIVERHLLVQLAGFDEELLLFEDYDLWLRLACHSEVDLIDQPLTGVRSHDQHYTESDRGISMPACRHRSLERVRPLVTDPRLRTVLDRLLAQSALQLANQRANVDRPAAARLLLTGCAHSWRYMNWWAGLLRVLLKLAVPRRLLGFYRRGGFRRRPATV